MMFRRTPKARRRTNPCLTALSIALFLECKGCVDAVKAVLWNSAHPKLDDPSATTVHPEIAR
jgi:hypothetical protein